MNVVRDYPPNFADIKLAFPVRFNTVYTYGDTIYAPEIRYALDPSLIKHEETHARQQGDDPAGWWERYIADIPFRFSQELEAYRRQYTFFCSTTRDRNQHAIFLHMMAQDLSGSLYGYLVSLQKATELIKFTGMVYTFE